MLFFLLGLVLLAVVLVAMHGFVGANPRRLAAQLKLAGGVLALTGAGLLAVRGGAGYAAPLAMLGAWLIWGGRPFARMRRSNGQTSQVTTDYLEMELDHDSGEIRGRVIRGLFEGRRIETLEPAELALLWQDARVDDAKSAQLIEAYLDRMYPSWREDMARGEREMRGPDGRMSAAEAYEILGLREGASKEEIRRAHRELIIKLHPDRGGSTYLASKINEAKEVLLGDRRQ
jgi:hypothetical protein